MKRAHFSALLGSASVLALVAWLAPVPAPLAAEPKEIDTLPYVINEPGSYRVTRNLTGAPGEHGILVEASNVSIDLCGFTLTGDDDSLDAVHAPDRMFVRVSGGALVNWQNGVSLGQRSEAMDLFVDQMKFEGIETSSSGRVSRCSVVRCPDGFAFDLGAFTQITDCTVDLADLGVNAGEKSYVARVAVANVGFGINVSRGSIVVDCTVDAFSETGIRVRGGCIVERCTVEAVTRQSGMLAGIEADGSGRVTGCTVNAPAPCGIRTLTAVVECSSARGAERGIEVGPLSRVDGCTVADSESGVVGQFGTTVARTTVTAGGKGISLLGDLASVYDCRAFDTAEAGIEIQGRSVARKNLAAGNVPDGLRARGDRNRILDNALYSNGVGLDLEGVGNLVTGNRAVGNGTDFVLPFPNTFGPTLNASWAIQGSVPQANFRTPFP